MRLLWVLAQTATPTEAGTTGGSPTLAAGLVVLAILAVLAGGSNWEALSESRARWLTIGLLLLALVALLV